MRSCVFYTLFVGCIVLGGCAAQNPWWEANQSGWASYGTEARVPRKAKPVPLSLMAEAARWNQSIYIEAWIDAVDQTNGAWMQVSDGTSRPVTVLPRDGYTLPRNARGRRVMAWGRPMIASGTIDDAGGAEQTSLSVDFLADSVMIQGFYGLEAPPRSPASGALPPKDRSVIEGAVESDPPSTEEVVETTPEPRDPAAPPPPIVDLPEH